MIAKSLETMGGGLEMFGNSHETLGNGTEMLQNDHKMVIKHLETFGMVRKH